jgi:hypothetical protein
MNRAVAVSDASIDAVKAVHAKVTHERKERRGIAGFAAAGFAGAAAFGGAGVEGAGESSLLIEISRCRGALVSARAVIDRPYSYY